eukprot:2540936-Pyramimonas_sp.AAC.1
MSANPPDPARPTGSMDWPTSGSPGACCGRAKICKPGMPGCCPCCIAFIQLEASASGGPTPCLL